jgi:hypothetical protein
LEFEEQSKYSPRPSTTRTSAQLGIWANVSLEVVRKLRRSNAQWPAILEQLNPTRAEPLATLLLDLRGPHMFDPGTALTVIEEGLQSAVRENASASTFEGLVAAKRSMEKVTRYGD